MIAKIQIPDGLQMGKSYKGSISLTSNGEGNFRKYNITSKKDAKRAFRKLSHGRISWTEENVKLFVHVDGSEQGVKPSDIISKDCKEAYEVIKEMEEA